MAIYHDDEAFRRHAIGQALEKLPIQAKTEVGRKRLKDFTARLQNYTSALNYLAKYPYVSFEKFVKFSLPTVELTKVNEFYYACCDNHYYLQKVLDNLHLSRQMKVIIEFCKILKQHDEYLDEIGLRLGIIKENYPVLKSALYLAIICTKYAAENLDSFPADQVSQAETAFHHQEIMFREKVREHINFLITAQSFEWTSMINTNEIKGIYKELHGNKLDLSKVTSPEIQSFAATQISETIVSEIKQASMEVSFSSLTELGISRDSSYEDTRAGLCLTFS